MEDLRAEVAEVTEAIRSFDARIEERTRDRLRLVEKMRGLLPDDQYQTFQAAITKAIETVKPLPDAEFLIPADTEKEDTVAILRKIRSQITTEVCEVIGVPAPKTK
jgi:KaiC/GvpD/RAD55 family RecA-like ATPase